MFLAQALGLVLMAIAVDLMMYPHGRGKYVKLNIDLPSYLLEKGDILIVDSVIATSLGYNIVLRYHNFEYRVTVNSDEVTDITFYEYWIKRLLR